VIGGIIGSYYLDLPAGPAIVVLAGLLFLVAAGWQWSQHGGRQPGTR
jgi:ABC-type Mn2+/Zn2+ transport system permease subunit